MDIPCLKVGDIGSARKNEKIKVFTDAKDSLLNETKEELENYIN